MQKLEFDCNRKLSSVIFRTNFGNEKKIYIVTKGSIDNMRNLIKDTDISRYNKVVDLYNTKYPYLRVIAFAIKELLCYGSKIDPKQYELSGNYTFLSILGIQDEIQPNVKNTISYLKSFDKSISICTGDRAITSLAIGKEIGMFEHRKNIRELTHENIEINQLW